MTILERIIQHDYKSYSKIEDITSFLAEKNYVLGIQIFLVINN